eukprot:CAMPEP_0119091736 /NCGR_PEP_ID=MMETSP1178-20130426/157359_1 /TAXON_ID=33656 /ORGANISM="unid sp, Strain CCMP2000" /LENGTH=42 /DNA_ID= /DNA_START= /DNA_END= /DNA_ORIENTATION=
MSALLTPSLAIAIWPQLVAAALDLSRVDKDGGGCGVEQRHAP